MNIETIHFKKVAVIVFSTDDLHTIAMFGGDVIKLQQQVFETKINGVSLTETPTSELAVKLYLSDDKDFKKLLTAAIIFRNFNINTHRLKIAQTKEEFEDCLDMFYELAKSLNIIVTGDDMSVFDVSYITSELINEIEATHNNAKPNSNNFPNNFPNINLN
jgi:hypothetical protein